MILKCYVVDDEKHASDVIATYIEMTEGLELIGTEQNPLIALKRISEHEIHPDITFLDIDMPAISGIELATLIERETFIIFTTAYSDYAVTAYEGNAIDYMVKPVSYVRFLKSVGKVRKLITQGPASKSEEVTGIQVNQPEEPPENYFFIKGDSKGKLIKLAVAEIIYAEAKHNFVELITKARSYIAYLSLSELEKTLPADRFTRIHKSCIINLEMIKSIYGNTVIMVNEQQFTVGRTYRQVFQAAIAGKYLGGTNPF